MRKHLQLWHKNSLGLIWLDFRIQRLISCFKNTASQEHLNSFIFAANGHKQMLKQMFLAFFFFFKLTFYLWYFFKCLNSYIFIFVNVREAENTGRKIGMGKSSRNCGDIHALRTVGQQAPWPFANQRWEQFVLSWLRNYPTQIIHFIQCLDWIMNCLHEIFFFERIMRNVFCFGLYLTLGP